VNITEADIATIHALLTDYQWYMDNYHNFVISAYRFPMFAAEKDARPYREVRERIANTAPLLTKVLSMELPHGFTLLKTIDEQCYAWNAHVTLGLHGPVSEFQARLWCWQNEDVDEEVRFQGTSWRWTGEGWTSSAIKVTEIEDDEDEETLEGFRASLGGVGNVTESGAVLDESVIDTMFKPYREAYKA
jgi:hypothetical protein